MGRGIKTSNTENKKAILTFGLWPAMWFFLAIFPQPSWISHLGFIFFLLSLIYMVVCPLKSCFVWLFFWGALLDVYKSLTFGINLSGLLLMGWIISQIKQKFIWHNYPTQIVFAFIIFLSLNLWHYSLDFLFDLSGYSYKLKDVFIFALKGALLAPIVFKIQGITSNNAS
ncbi:MAG: hypothetical protein J7M03_05205 [Candidatus Desulfofervidaceae bacterium]|nr:hypothetical protein [Candidatus Desulfofervidaceae bacterium]MDL1969594.1 hypothetical protein [Candidatus Desulfofervidaceae bacterium]